MYRRKPNRTPLMKNTPRKMSLKPYLDTIREHCQGLSNEELVETLLELAQEVPTRGREEFLDKIRASAPRSVADRKKAGKAIEDALLERIAVLGEEVAERIESIENGDYWEDSDHWHDRGYNDEEPDYVSPEQIEELEDLFLEIGGVFLDGRLEVACRLYRALFGLLAEQDEIASYLPRGSVDLREERARYCRCVYETVDPKQRVDSVLDCIDIDAPLSSYRFDLPSEKFPMLQDVIDARPNELEDWQTFLPAWNNRLSHCPGDRAAMLKMEAVRKFDGTEGVSKLARKWKSAQPRGYLFWIQCLEDEGNRQEMLDVSREALEILPKGHFREQVAECLTTAAAQLGRTELVLTGKRERFLSKPGETNLIELLDEARKQSLHSRELDNILASFEQRGSKNEEVPVDLRTKVLLMAGKLREAFKEARHEKSLGWSYGKAGVLFASIVSVLTENSSKTGATRALLKEYAERREYYDDRGEHSQEGKLFKEILAGLESVKITESEAREYGEWADKIGRARIEAIVSAQHRGAYDRAASVLVALAEYCLLTKGSDKARSLVNEFVNVKFPRHRAFRKEVQNATSRSTLIKELRVV